jgi:hypothetical protein
MMKSITRVGHIKPVFHYGSDDEKKMRVQVARISVLYDDLMLEYTAAREEAMPLLDGSGLNARRFYFVRRNIGTMMELRGAFAVLNKNDTFNNSKQWWPDADVRMWDDAIAFYDANHKFLRDWRNDVGGHFLDSAAEFAIDSLEPDVVGAIEIYRRGAGADIRMKFAYSLVAGALIKNRNSQVPEEQFFNEAFTFLFDAITHAIKAVSVIAVHELIPKFK